MFFIYKYFNLKFCQKLFFFLNTFFKFFDFRLINIKNNINNL